MKNILWYILNKIRYFICLVLIIYIALPLVPLIVFTKWSWSWLWMLIIANEKCCSLLEAKKIYLENKDEKYTFKPSKQLNSNNEYKVSNLDNSYNERNNPTYSYLPSNIYHDLD